MNINFSKYNDFFLFRNLDNEKIGLYFSFFFHFIFLMFIIGFPDLFKNKEISLPNIIPIEIINVTDITSIPKDNKQAKEEPANQQTPEIKKFNNVENNNDIQPDLKTTTEKIIEENQDVLEEIVVKEKVKESTIVDKDDKIKPKEEILPTKKILPKLKPKIETKTIVEKESDVEIKIKSKPKPIFDIASMLKDLRNDESLISEKIEEEDKKNVETNEENLITEKAVLSISEIDLLISQLSSCWTAPAGALIEKGMVVKITANVKPDKSVLYETVRILDTNISKTNPFYGPITESAMRTLLNPECNPLKLPDNKYDLWKKLTIKFDHSIMKGYQ